VFVDFYRGTDDLVRNFIVGHRGASGTEFNTECTEVTEEEKRRLCYGDFFIGAEDVAEGGADFA
jgi:hypothetical protein